MAAGDIILGDGVFAIGEVDVGLTRGGGKFIVEREFKPIEADGDYGIVKDRVRKIKSQAKLTLNALETLSDNLPKLYAATKVTTGKFTGKADIETADYNDTVTWTGKTKAGKSVVITLENAINLENIDWGLVDKDEIVAAITYTATYLEDARTVEPWDVTFVTGT